MPIKSVAQAIAEAQVQIMGQDKNVFLIGEGLSDSDRTFGTTAGIREAFPDRIFDMPVSENAVTGICVGAAISGLRPIMMHMRADFLLYAMDQLVNSAAKMHAMYGGQLACPFIVRAVMGRGWGQGVQHSQRLEKIFDEIPGLKVIIPSNAYDAKGMLIWASRQKNPILFFEHRWIHELKCEVPDEMYEIYPDPVRLTYGQRVIQTYGYLVHEALEAAKYESISVCDMRGPKGGMWVEKSCCPPSPHLSKGFYPSAQDLGAPPSDKPHDVPNPDFKGPF